MRVLLLGATGNLGRHLLPALLSHQHTPTLLLRDPSKLPSLFSAPLLALLPPSHIYTGDATSAALIARILRERDIEAVVNVAGNQVLPWRDHVLGRIVGAVMGAAGEVGGERRRGGRPVLRVWVLGGVGALDLTGDGRGRRIEDFFPKLGVIQHQETRDITTATPLSSVAWSYLAIGLMFPRRSPLPIQALPPRPSPPSPTYRSETLLVRKSELPEWRDTWLIYVPIVGMFLNIFWLVEMVYGTRYVDVADFLAGDLGAGVGSEWVGGVVGVKEKGKGRGEGEGRKRV